MSVINNDHPGSSLRVLCHIDRFLNMRKMTPAMQQDLLDVCRPDNLPGSNNAGKKFLDNLRFWLAQGLWRETDQGIVASGVDANDSNLPQRVLLACIDDCKSKDIIDPSGTKIEPLMRTLACLLAQDKYVFGGVFLKSGANGTIRTAINTMLPLELNIGAHNEAGTLRDFAEFLGFIEPVENSAYVLDPTRAIQSVLDEVFDEQQELSIAEFVERLATVLPMLDGGVFRTQVEELMSDRGWTAPAPHQLSASLSFALSRLEAAMIIAFKTYSDDAEQLQLILGNETRPVSKVVLREVSE